MVSPTGVLAAEWTFATTTCLFLILRFYVKRHIVRVGIQREDFLLAGAQMLFFCWISQDTFTISRGFMSNGRSYFDNFVEDLRHVEHLSDPQIIKILKVVYASAPPYYLCLWLIKFAIIGLYFRIVPKGTKTRKFLYFTAVYTLLSGICVLLVNVLLCIPIKLNWSLDFDSACYSSTAITPFIISVIFNLSTDVLIFIVPFPVVRKLKSLNQKQKIGLIVTFSLGAITIIVCLARAGVIGGTGSITDTAVLTAAECFTALLVASLPALRPLLKTRPFRRKERKSDMSTTEENMTVSDIDSRHHDYVPRGLPARHMEKSIDGSLPPLPSAFTTEIAPSGNSYVIHQQPPVDQNGYATQRHGGSGGGSGGYNSYSSQSQYSTGGYQAMSPPGIRHDEFSLKEHLGSEHDFEDIEDYNHGERVQLVSLNSNPNSRLGAVSPTRYENYYGRRALSPQNQMPPAPPPGYPHQNMFIPDSPLPPVPQHAQQHPSGDPFMPDYLHEPAPNPTI